MTERLYAEHPALYDAIQAGWDYDRDVAFVEEAAASHGVTGRRLLEVGCGTGEHTQGFVNAGFDVIAIDPVPAMLEVAREKRTADGRPLADAATLRRDALPDLAVDGPFDLAVCIRGVINHLPPADLEPAMAVLGDALAPGGLLIFDNSPLPKDGNEPALDVGTYGKGRYVRSVQMVGRDDGRLDWNAAVFTPDGEAFTSSQPMTPFDDATVRDALEAAGFAVETRDGYGPDDRRTVFVAVAP